MSTFRHKSFFFFLHPSASPSPSPPCQGILQAKKMAADRSARPSDTSPTHDRLNEKISHALSGAGEQSGRQCFNDSSAGFSFMIPDSSIGPFRLAGSTLLQQRPKLAIYHGRVHPTKVHLSILTGENSIIHSMAFRPTRPCFQSNQSNNIHNNNSVHHFQIIVNNKHKKKRKKKKKKKKKKKEEEEEEEEEDDKGGQVKRKKGKKEKNKTKQNKRENNNKIK